MDTFKNISVYGWLVLLVIFLKAFIIAMINIVIRYTIDIFIKSTSSNDKQYITMVICLLLSFIAHKKN
jgi:hypothetical protein